MRLQIEVLGAKNPVIRNLLTNRALAPVRWIIGKLYVFCFMGYCLVPFTFFNDYWEIYRSVYFMGFIFFLVIYLIFSNIYPAITIVLLYLFLRAGD